MGKDYIPYPYQQYTTQRMIDTPYLGAFLDMGLGKTVCTLTTLHSLKYEMWNIHKALIIAPKKVAEITWTKEAAKWNHLRNLRVVTVLGSARKRKAALSVPADVYVINRDNTKWIVDLYRYDWPFDVVVLDESSSFKSQKTQRFKALKLVRPKIKRLIELTGTPSPKGLMDLWAQLYLLDGGERLGRTISVYREMFFTPGRRNRNTIFDYKLKPGAEQAIYTAISDICISMKSEDYLNLPDLIVDDIPVMLDEAARTAYDNLAREALLTVGGEIVTELTGAKVEPCVGMVFDTQGNSVKIDSYDINAYIAVIRSLGAEKVIIYHHMDRQQEDLMAVLTANGFTVRHYGNRDDIEMWKTGKCNALLVDGNMITATTAAALTNKLLQCCNGAVYDENNAVIPIHNCKLEVLLETVEQLNGQHVIIYYHYKHDRDRLWAALAPTDLRVRVYRGAQDEADWNAGNIDVLLAQPASCGYGLNLQDGGHHVIWFGLTWNLEEYQQANKRCHRQGQQYPVIIHRLIVQGGMDEDVIQSLEAKDAGQESLLTALKARIEQIKGDMQK